MNAFLKAIDDVRNRYFTFQEFPLISREIFPPNCLADAMSVGKSKLRSYALRLKGAQLEGLLLDLVTADDPVQIDRGIEILYIRCSLRIKKLIGLLMQYYFDKTAIVFLGKRIIGPSADDNVSDLFLRKFAPSDHKPKLLAEVIIEYKDDIRAVYEKYSIIEKSPLAMEGSVLYFSICDKNAYMKNYIALIELIRALPTEKTYEPIKHYLETFSMEEYYDLVNSAIADKLGQPYVSPDWSSFPDPLRRKFTQWSYLYKLKLHCKEMPEKLKTMIKYFHQVRTNYLINEQQILVTDYGWLVMADEKGSKETYLYEKNFFEKEMTNWEQEGTLPIFLKRNHDIMSSRDFMLSTDDASCIKLIFEDVQFYFIEEVLDIKLGLEPDMRRRDII